MSNPNSSGAGAPQPTNPNPTPQPVRPGQGTQIRQQPKPSGGTNPLGPKGR